MIRRTIYMITTESFPPHPPPIANTNVIFWCCWNDRKLNHVQKWFSNGLKHKRMLKIIEHYTKIIKSGVSFVKIICGWIVFCYHEHEQIKSHSYTECSKRKLVRHKQSIPKCLYKNLDSIKDISHLNGAILILMKL